MSVAGAADSASICCCSLRLSLFWSVVVGSGVGNDF